jgi:hypothetical protein
MSLGTFNFAIPQGNQEQNCTPGSPVGGLDSNNIFRLLKLSPDGTAMAASRVSPSLYNNSTNVGSAPLTTGIKTANLLLSYSIVINTSLNGIFEFRPFVNLFLTGSGTINIFFVTSGSAFDTYLSSLVPGTDLLNPTIANLNSGLVQFFHQGQMATSGSNVANYLNPTAANQLNGKALLSGITKMAIVANSNLTIADPGILFGLNYLTQIA